MGLRRLRVCAAVSHRPGLELGTEELQRKPQKTASALRPAHTRPSGAGRARPKTGGRSRRAGSQTP